MTDTTFPNAALARLNALAGHWSTRIVMLDDHGAEAEEFFATDIYRWMPGRHFLVHDVEAHMGGEPVRSMEIIGMATDGDSYVTRNYDNAGQVSDYTAALEGRQWRIDGATERFRGDIAGDGNTVSGLWQRHDADRWLDWMRVTLTRRV
jgi:hypothetical protein